jgi:hypothetical protein
MFIRLAAAHDVAAQIAYRGASLADAAHDVVMNKLPRLAGRGGMIAVDAHGNVAMPFNTEGMYRGYARRRRRPWSASTATTRRDCRSNQETFAMTSSRTPSALVLPEQRVVAVDGLSVTFRRETRRSTPCATCRSTSIAARRSRSSANRARASRSRRWR